MITIRSVKFGWNRMITDWEIYFETINNCQAPSWIQTIWHQMYPSYVDLKTQGPKFSFELRLAGVLEIFKNLDNFPIDSHVKISWGH